MTGIKNIFIKKENWLIMWIIIAAMLAIKEYVSGSINNYLIFKYVFHHAIEQVNLYSEYPSLYSDSNHYGPFFSLIIMPFALLPNYIGVVLWNILNAFVLAVSILKLNLNNKKIIIIFLIVTNNMITSAINIQSNALIGGMIVLSYIFVKNEKDIWASLMIVMGTFIKLYGIVGLAFFFFSKNKLKFIGYGLIWAGIAFILPMLFSSPEFIIQSYIDWFSSLVAKNGLNTNLNATLQDISTMGIFRRILEDSSIPNSLFLIPALIIFTFTYLIYLYNYNNNSQYQLLLLSSVLIFTTIFSSGSEYSTYVIAMTGVAIWYVHHDFPVKKSIFILMIITVFISGFSLSDITIPYIRDNYIRPYSLVALPCTIVWLFICYQMFAIKKNNYSKSE